MALFFCIAETMCKKIIPAFFICLFSVFQLSAGSDTTFSRFKPSEESSLLLFTAGYRLPVNKASILNSGHGIYMEAGMNPGHFISKKLVVGLFAGWAWKDRFWSTSFNNDFINDYRSAIDVEPHFSTLDSAVIYASADAFETKSGTSLTLPGCEMKSFHNHSWYYGAVIRLPYRYLPTAKVYMGVTSSSYQGHGDLITKQKEYNVLQLKRAMYGCELIIFRGFQSVSSTQNKYPVHKNIGTFSVYYESYDFYNSSLEFYDGEQTSRIPLKRFASRSFLQKYKNENAWGIKLAFSIM